MTTEPSQGSSPRMRGTLISVPFRIQFLWDHPRVCGEHRGMDTRRETRPGSSPRMRGTLSWRVPHGVSAGIIPAYAGNTTCMTCTLDSRRDHPRVCGEHSFHRNYRCCAAGSSPRMRGTPWVDIQGGGAHGIIPAYAGNTCTGRAG